MNQRQKEIAESIIAILKEKDGLIHHINTLIASGHEDRIVITSGLQDLGLIEMVQKDGRTYRLTEKGWDFTTFNEYEKIKERDESIKDFTLENLKRNIFQVKYWWLILLINTIIALIIGLILKY